MIFPYRIEPGKWMVNLASQELPGAHAELKLLESGLRKTFSWMEAQAFDHIAFPQIGAGIGGLA